MYYYVDSESRMKLCFLQC